MILVSKVLQNVHNHVLFSSKEEELLPLNELIVSKAINEAKELQLFLAVRGARKRSDAVFAMNIIPNTRTGERERPSARRRHVDSAHR